MSWVLAFAAVTSFGCWACFHDAKTREGFSYAMHIIFGCINAFLTVGAILFWL